MKSFVQELSVKKVLSREDILLLKEYINRKYIEYTSAQKSDVLTNAVYQILDKNIPGLRPEYRQVVTQSLLKNTILKDGQTILLLDIFNACISKQDKSSDFLDNLINWVNFHVENKISKVELDKYDLELNAMNNNEPRDLLNEQNVEYTAEITNYCEPINNFTLKVKSKNIINSRIIKYSSYILAVFILAFLIQYKMNGHFFFSKYQEGQKVLNINAITDKSYNKIYGMDPNKSLASKLPDNFKYKDVNETLLKNFLIGKNSLLAEEPYFSTIISVSKVYNLNPLVLFAITGQEQGFVAKQAPYSKKIANNPFNVYHSWKEYNTNIEDACSIACLTIINLCKDRPEASEPFKWINRTYAEDPNWSRAVNMIYANLEQNNLKGTIQ